MIPVSRVSSDNLSADRHTAILLSAGATRALPAILDSAFRGAPVTGLQVSIVTLIDTVV